MAEEAKQTLAEMELEDERIEEAVEEEGRQRLIQQKVKGYTIVSDQEVIEGLDEVSSDSDEEDDSEPGKVEVLYARFKG